MFKTALATGATIWSGADYYGTPDANSLHLMNRYFAAYPADAEKVTLVLKGGVVDASTMDCTPEGMRRTVENCNRLLDGRKKIDFFGPARIDPKIPIETTIGALGDLVKEGLISGIILSEASASTIRKAEKVHHIAMVEAEISLWATDVLHNGVATTCSELGITMLAHTPLGRGMLAGKFQSHEDVANGEYHSMFPRFQGENFENNLKLVKELHKISSKKGCTDAQLALAWLRYQGGMDGFPTIIPLAGARSAERVKENNEDIKLTVAEDAVIETILQSFPIAGERYPDVAASLLEY